MKYGEYMASMKMEDVETHENKSDGYTIALMFILCSIMLLGFGVIVYMMMFPVEDNDASVVENCTLGINGDIKFRICTDVNGESMIEIIEDPDFTEPTDIDIIEEKTAPKFETKTYRER